MTLFPAPHSPYTGHGRVYAGGRLTRGCRDDSGPERRRETVRYLRRLNWFLFVFLWRMDPWGLGRMGVKYAWQAAVIMTEAQ